VDVVHLLSSNCSLRTPGSFRDGAVRAGRDFSREILFERMFEGSPNKISPKRDGPPLSAHLVLVELGNLQKPSQKLKHETQRSRVKAKGDTLPAPPDS